METADLATRESRGITETTVIIITGEAGVAHPTETGGMRGTAGTPETEETGEKIETDLRPEWRDVRRLPLVTIINLLPTEILPGHLRPSQLLLKQPSLMELQEPTKSIKSGKPVKLNLHLVTNDLEIFV